MTINIPRSPLILLLFSLLVAPTTGQQKADERERNGKAVTSNVSGEDIAAKLSGRRDLSKYADGGHFRFASYSLKPDERSKNLSSLARFLVESLEGKRLAYARATFSGIDAGSTYHFFVEPDRSGRWKVTTRMVGWHALLKANRVLDFPIIFRLEEVVDRSMTVAIKFFGRSDKEIEDLRIE